MGKTVKKFNGKKIDNLENKRSKSKSSTPKKNSGKLKWIDPESYIDEEIE